MTETGADVKIEELSCASRRETSLTSHPGFSRFKPRMPRILVIDDEPAIRVMVERILSSAGHEVVLAADGVEGVKQQQTAPSQLIITDLFMPNEEGLELIIHLRKEFPNIPIIAMSGKPAGGTLLDISQRLGAVTILQKPFSAEQFIAAVAKVF